jgi:hypothetical protein
MRNLCEKHHLTYTGAHCPLCEKERIASFKVSKRSLTLPKQASRELYYEEYMPKPLNDDIMVIDNINKIDADKKYNNMSDADLADLLASKFGNVSIKK